MNPPNLTVEVETDALRGDLRPCETSPRPIPLPERGRHSAKRGPAMTVKPPAPPPLPDELDRCCAGSDSHTFAEPRRR